MVSDADLGAYFSRFGPLIEARVNGQGFGHVTFASNEVARSVCGTDGGDHHIMVRCTKSCSLRSDLEDQNFYVVSAFQGQRVELAHVGEVGPSSLVTNQPPVQRGGPKGPIKTRICRHWTSSGRCPVT
eukprot:SAG31_NODE_787_length_12094_cov_27.048270_5_plen_128_part_00